MFVILVMIKVLVFMIGGMIWFFVEVVVLIDVVVCG